MISKTDLTIVRTISKIRQLDKEYHNTPIWNPIKRIKIGIEHDNFLRKLIKYLACCKLEDMGIEDTV